MNLLELFSQSFTSLRSNLMRTLLTMLGIIIGISSVIMIIAIGQGAQAYVVNQVSSFGTNLISIAPGNTEGVGIPVSTLTYNNLEALKKSKDQLGVDLVSAIGTTSSTVTYQGVSKRYIVIGSTFDGWSIFSLNIAKGNFLTDEDNQGLSKVAVIGPDIATELFGEGSDVIGKSIQIDSKTFKITGILESKSGSIMNWNKSVYIPLKTGFKTVLPSDKLQEMYVTAKDVNNIEFVKENVKNFMLSEHNISNPKDADFQVNTSKDALGIVNTITSVLTYMLAGIAGISLVVGGIGIMNIMLVTVTERTREIGLLKAIGAKRKDILNQFLVEAIVLTIAGGIVGIILGLTGSFFIAKAIGIPFVLKSYSIILAVGMAVIVGIVFGLYPARKAAKLNPIDALRFE